MKKFLFIALSGGTSLSALVYLLSCLTPHISPHIFWPMAFLTLGFPYLAFGMFVLAIVWLFVKRKVSLLLLAIILVGYNNLFSTFAIHAFTKPIAKPSNALRIMTWNVRGFDNPSDWQDSVGSVRQRMFGYIKDSAPDVICMQEYTEHLGRGMVNNTTELLDMGYNYHYETGDFSNKFSQGYAITSTAIFSKLPITDSGKMMFDDSSHTEYMEFVEVKFHGKPLRIYSAHFRSLALAAVLIDNNTRTLFYGDSNFIYKASKYEKLKIFPRIHARQSRMAKDFMNKSPCPVIFCADMNSVPASYPYHVMKSGMQDAFLQKGFGLGTTMDSLPATLRIDYILADRKLVVKNYFKSELHLSDHFPQVADLVWK